MRKSKGGSSQTRLRIRVKKWNMWVSYSRPETKTEAARMRLEFDFRGRGTENACYCKCGTENLGVGMKISEESWLAPLLPLIGASIVCQYQLSPGPETSSVLEIFSTDLIVVTFFGVGT